MRGSSSRSETRQRAASGAQCAACNASFALRSLHGNSANKSNFQTTGVAAAAAGQERRRGEALRLRGAQVAQPTPSPASLWAPAGRRLLRRYFGCFRVCLSPATRPKPAASREKSRKTPKARRKSRRATPTPHQKRAKKGKAKPRQDDDDDDALCQPARRRLTLLAVKEAPHAGVVEAGQGPKGLDGRRRRRCFANRRTGAS